MDSPRWVAAAHDRQLGRELSAALGISPLTAGLLIARGVRDAFQARRFINPSLSDLADPFDLPGMDRAAARLARAVRESEQILVYGDYDADGVTAAALLTHFFRSLGLRVQTYLPCRFEDGYGLRREPLEQARRDGAGLVVTVDCGCDALEEIARARACGLDVIVTDHHLTRDDRRLPAEVPHVNPRLAGTPEALADLAGVGVAFELARALARTAAAGEETPGEESVVENYLDLAAAGTIADRAALRGENRILAGHGLRRLAEGRRPSFRELLLQSGHKPSAPVSERTIGFVIGPVINAAGRMGHAREALDFLLTEDETLAGERAAALNRTNRQRQRVQKKILDEALKRAGNEPPEQAALVLHDHEWHPGVAGIVAGRLADEFGKPAFVFCPEDGGSWRGSGRSAAGIDLFEAVDACRAHLDPGCLESFGGHRKAVGVSIRGTEAGSDAGGDCRLVIEDFRAALEKTLRGAAGSGTPELRIDSFVNLPELTPELVAELGRLAPHGKGNEEPLLATLGLEVQKYSRLVGRNHLRLWLKGGDIYREGIAFNQGEWLDHLPAGSFVDAAYTPRNDEFNGISRLELVIRSFRRSEAGVSAGNG